MENCAGHESSFRTAGEIHNCQVSFFRRCTESFDISQRRNARLPVSLRISIHPLKLSWLLQNKTNSLVKSYAGLNSQELTTALISEHWLSDKSNYRYIRFFFERTHENFEF